MTRDIPRTKWAAIHINNDFLYVESRSGYTRNLYDPDGYHVYLDPNSSSYDLGFSILTALMQSRIVDPDIDRNFFTAETIVANEKRWIREVMERYGYKTKKKMFDHLAFVFVRQDDGKIKFEPRHWVKTEYWSDLPEDQNVIIPETADEHAVGEAARLALSRCT